MNSNNVILKGSNLSKSFGATVAVNNVSFELEEGEILGLVGENGAGKTTLIKLLGGEYSPDSGDILYEGKKVRWESPYHALKSRIAVVHQNPLLVPDFNIKENIFLGKEYEKKWHLIDNVKIEKITNELIKRYPIYSNLDLEKKVSLLSVGEKVIAEILRALSYDPKILILDEPTSSLPKEEANNLLKLLKQLNKEKRLSMIFISHRIEEVLDFSERIMVLRNGSNVGMLTRRYYDKAKIIQMMINYDLTAFYPDKIKNAGDLLLEVKNLSSKKIKEININVRAGEIVGLYGLMGAGTSEIVEILYKGNKSSEGELWLAGVGRMRFSQINPSNMIEKGIFFITGDRQRRGIFPPFNVRENTSIGLLDYYFKLFIDQKKEEREVKKVLKKLSVKYTSINQRIDELSGGNQQKVLVARWLMKDCNLLILDDPTIGVDIGAKKDIYDLLRELTLNGKGIIFVTSELDEVVGMADRVYTIKSGIITGELTGNEITKDNILNKIL